MPDKVDEIHDALMSDPEFSPESGQSKDESAWAVANAKVNQMNSNEAAHELEREYAGFDFWKRHHKNLKKNTARLTPYEPQQTKRTLKKAGPPGPPPRPGLEWNPNSRRWVRPKNNPANRELPKESEKEKDTLVNLLDSLMEEKNKLDSELEETWAKAHAATRDDRDEKISEAKKISSKIDSKLSEIHSVGTKLHSLWKGEGNMSISFLLKQGDTATSGPPRIPTKPHRMEPPKPSVVKQARGNAPPGPPPRPGLAWNPISHRWVKDKSRNSLFEQRRNLYQREQKLWEKAYEYDLGSGFTMPTFQRRKAAKVAQKVQDERKKIDEKIESSFKDKGIKKDMDTEIKKSLPSILKKRYGNQLKKMGIKEEVIKSPKFKDVKNYMKKNYNMDVVKVDNITEREVKI